MSSEVVARPGHGFQRLTAGGHHLRPIAEPLQQPDRDELVDGVVFGDQYSPAPSGSRLGQRMAGDDGCRGSAVWRAGGMVEQGDQTVVQRRLPERLGEEGGEPGVLSVARLPSGADRGEQDQPGRGDRGLALDAPAQVHSADAGHVHVDQGDVEGQVPRGGVPKELQRPRAVRSHDRLQTPAAELLLQVFPAGPVVIHYQRAIARE